MDFKEDFWDVDIPGLNITLGTLIIAIIVTFIAYVILVKFVLRTATRRP